MSDHRTPLDLAAENLRACAIIDDATFRRDAASGFPDDHDFEPYLLPAHTIGRNIVRVEGTPSRLAEKVFESIDVTALARALAKAEAEYEANDTLYGVWFSVLAEAVKTHLMREDDS